jgi:translation elongation factor EF-1alpha
MRKQILFAYTMGIEYMIVVVNKMNTTDPLFSEERFNEIKIEVLSHLKIRLVIHHKILSLSQFVLGLVIN